MTYSTHSFATASRTASSKVAQEPEEEKQKRAGEEGASCESHAASVSSFFTSLSSGHTFVWFQRNCKNRSRNKGNLTLVLVSISKDTLIVSVVIVVTCS